MKAVWKFEFPIQGEPFFIEMPIKAEIIKVEKQRGNMCFWAICDPDLMKLNRKFMIYGTGQEIIKPSEKIYQGTAVSDMLVWHLFEVIQTLY